MTVSAFVCLLVPSRRPRTVGWLVHGNPDPRTAQIVFDESGRFDTLARDIVRRDRYHCRQAAEPEPLPVPPRISTAARMSPCGSRPIPLLRAGSCQARAEPSQNGILGVPRSR